MIGRIKGILLEKQIPTLLVDVAGIGYELLASMHTFYRLPALGNEVVLHTHLVTREDAQLLYAFATREERSLFRVLIRVSGIGPKSALTILSSIEPQEFVHCILSDDLGALTRLPGIGKKTGQRLLIEMRDKLNNFEIEAMATEMTFDQGEGEIRAVNASVLKDAISALVTLGYKQAEARRVVLQHRAENLSSEELIRVALKELGK
jgi:holliday junction DNA helicase RuvA